MKITYLWYMTEPFQKGGVEKQGRLKQNKLPEICVNVRQYMFISLVTGEPCAGVMST